MVVEDLVELMLNNRSLCATAAASLSPDSRCSKSPAVASLMHNARLSGQALCSSHIEINDEEQLVVNLEEVDCTTFVEYVLAQSLATVRSGNGRLPEAHPLSRRTH